MGVLQGVSAQFALQKGYSSKQVSQQYSLRVLFFILAIHMAIIFIAITSHFHKSEQTETTIKLMLIYAAPLTSAFSSETPSIQRDIQFSSPIVPELVFPQLETDVSILNASDLLGQEAYELLTKKSGRYKDVFNPELRKKLQDLPERKITKSKIQYLGVGVTLEDIGDGMCLYGDAFAKTGQKVKCGPDQGEQMMINVEHVLADPLHLNE